jgi:myxalamid-type polyketide synthase MxaC
LDDGILLHLNADRLRTVMAPKVDGAWNLHTLTTDKPLDFFVLFSSVASLLGSPGQGNYSAANAFLDALAYHRRRQGQVGLSINWGPWSEIGLAAAQAKANETPTVGGIRAIIPEQGIEIFGHLLGQNAIQVSVMALNLHQWRQFHPKASQSTLFSHLIEEKQAAVQSTQSNRLRNMFRVAAPDQRRQLIGNYLHEQITHVLRLDPTQLDENTPFGSLGFDSLMALELRNQLEDHLGLNLPVTLIWNYQTIAELTSHLAEKMGYSLDQAASSVSEDAPEAEAESLEQLLSDEERESLTALLSELDGTSLDDLQQALADKEN